MIVGFCRTRTASAGDSVRACRRSTWSAASVSAVVPARPLLLLLLRSPLAPAAAPRRQRRRRRPAPARRSARATRTRTPRRASASRASPPRTRRAWAAPTRSPTPRASPRPSTPSRSRDTRPEVVSLVDADDWRAAISAAQLMAGRCARRCCSPTAATAGRDAGGARALEPTGAPKAGDAQVIRVGKTRARPRALQDDRRRRRRPGRLAARASTALQRPRAGTPTPRRDRGAADAPAFAMPAAGWAAKAGDPVLWSDKDTLPGRHPPRSPPTSSPRSTCSGPAAAISDNGAQGARRARHRHAHLGPRPGRQRDRLRPLHRRALRLERRRPRPRARVRTTERPADAAAAAAAVGARHLRPAAARHRRATRSRAPVQDYLLDIQPGYDEDPVRGVYNHGWLVGRRGARSRSPCSRASTPCWRSSPSTPTAVRSAHGRSRAARAPRARPPGHRRGRAPADGRVDPPLRAAAAQPHRAS